MRTHESFSEAIGAISRQTTQDGRIEMAKWWGVNELSVFSWLPTIDLSISFTHDFMHLIFENVVPNLVSLWSGQGKFASMDEGQHSYRIAPHIWDQIGAETAAAVATIPSAFVSHLFDISAARSCFKAETWAFWFMHLAPNLLKNCFPNPKFYKHMCDLVYFVYFKQTTLCL